MTPVEILSKLADQGFSVRQDPAGAGLLLRPGDDAPADLVDLVRTHKVEIVAHLRGLATAEPILEATKSARPPDVKDAQWEVALRGLRTFLAAGHGDEAECLGWPRDEVYAVPPQWSRVDLCGAGLLIGDREVVEITPAEIRIKTASGAIQAFYRKPQVDYALVFRERLGLFGLDASKEEVRLRAFEHVVNFCRANTGMGLEQAKALVLSAIEKAKETTPP